MSFITTDEGTAHAVPLHTNDFTPLRVLRRVNLGNRGNPMGPCPAKKKAPPGFPNGALFSPMAAVC